jgi:hypothetical protein
MKVETKCITCCKPNAFIYVKIPQNTYCADCYGKHHDPKFLIWRRSHRSNRKEI